MTEEKIKLKDADNKEIPDIMIDIHNVLIEIKDLLNK